MTSNAKARRDLRINAQPVRRSQTASTPTPLGQKTDRIRVHLWTRRGLSGAEEDALTSELGRLRADQHWNWTGTDLVGDMWTDAELTDGDVVDHLCALQSHANLVRIDLSQPHPSDQRPVAWLRVRPSQPELPSLCALYRDRLLTAATVIRALGGFVPGMPGESWLDDG